MINQLAVTELVDEFQHLDEREACQYLEELGRELPEVPASLYEDSNLVPGCQSRVWLVPSLTDGTPAKVRLQVDSDAFVVKGLSYVALQMYDNLTPREVLDVDYESVFDRMGLGRLILPQRKNGLHSLVNKIRTFAAEALGERNAGAASGAHAVRPVEVTSTRAIKDIKSEFPILNRPLPSGELPVFLDSGASAQKPACVIDKQREVEEQYYANAFRGRYYFGQRVDDEIEATRNKVAALLGAHSTDEIVFTAGTTMSINVVASAWGRKYLRPGSEVVVTEMEHHANFVPWQVLAREKGATFKIIPITDDGRLDLEIVESMITDRTAIVAVASMSNVLGTINPIAEIVHIAKSRGAVTLVDAAQSIPHQQMNVAELDADFVTFSGHKLYGPSGVGVLYGRRELLLAMDPFLFGGHMIEHVGREQSTWAGLPSKFEAGTMPIVPIIGLGAAVDFVNSIGFEAIESHERALLTRATERLQAIPGLTIYGPELASKGAIVSFSIDGVSSEDLSYRLDDRGICTRHGHHCTMVLHQRLGVPATTRASFGVYNTFDDIERLAETLEYAVGELSS